MQTMLWFGRRIVIVILALALVLVVLFLVINIAVVRSGKRENPIEPASPPAGSLMPRPTGAAVPPAGWATDPYRMTWTEQGAKSGTYYANARFYSADITTFPQPVTSAARTSP
jgi:hypothetical protein